MNDKIEEVGAAFEGLFPAHKASMHLTHNGHLAYYETAQQHMGSRATSLNLTDPFQADEWLSREDYDAAMASNTIWELQWYPDTPVGFCVVFGSTLANALLKAGEP